MQSKIFLILGKIYEEVCKKKFSSWSLWEEVIYRDGTPGKTSKPVIHFNVDLQEDPYNRQIRQSDLKEAARVCGFTNDPYTMIDDSPIIFPLRAPCSATIEHVIQEEMHDRNLPKKEKCPKNSYFD